MNFVNVLITVAILVAFGIPGYLLRKFKLIGDAAVKGLVVVLIYAAQPATIAKSFLSLKYSPELGKNILFLTFAFIFVTAAVFFAAAIIFRDWKKRKAQGAGEGRRAMDNEGQTELGMRNEELGINVPAAHKEDGVVDSADSADAAEKAENNRLYRFAAMFGNVGFMGLPIIMVLFPENDTVLLYASLCIVLFNIMTWTAGVWVITGDRKMISLKKCLLTPVLVTVVVTLPFFFIPESVFAAPKPVINFFGSLSDMTTPLSMIILGARMAEMPFLEIFTDFHIYIVSALKLLLAPALTFAALKLFKIDNADLFNALMIINMMPAAASAMLFAENFLKKAYTGVKAVLFTSVLCIVTIPLMCLLLM